MEGRRPPDGPRPLTLSPDREAKPGRTAGARAGPRSGGNWTSGRTGRLEGRRGPRRVDPGRPGVRCCGQPAVALCSWEVWAAHTGMAAPRPRAHRALMSISRPHPSPPTEFIARLRESRFANGLSCLRCGAVEGLHRWGRFAGRQRYRCRSCRRTFSDLTGTPARYIKKLALWPDYAGCLRAGVSVRRAAAAVGIHPSSAFRWRHRLLDELRTRDVEAVSGWVEISALRFAYSEKGSRRLTRETRRRGRSRPGQRVEPHTLVLLACDRLGGAVSALARPFGTGPRTANVMEAVLGGRIVAKSMLTADEGRFGPTGTLARRLRLAFHAARPSPACSAHVLAHTRTNRGYGERLNEWLRRFRGVATAYLPNYLIWHRAVDLPDRHGVDRAVLRWPLENDRE